MVAHDYLLATNDPGYVLLIEAVGLDKHRAEAATAAVLGSLNPRLQSSCLFVVSILPTLEEVKAIRPNRVPVHSNTQWRKCGAKYNGESLVL